MQYSIPVLCEIIINQPSVFELYIFGYSDPQFLDMISMHALYLRIISWDFSPDNKSLNFCEIYCVKSNLWCVKNTISLLCVNFQSFKLITFHSFVNFIFVFYYRGHLKLLPLSWASQVNGEASLLRLFRHEWQISQRVHTLFLLHEENLAVSASQWKYAY